MSMPIMRMGRNAFTAENTATAIGCVTEAAAGVAKMPTAATALQTTTARNAATVKIPA